ncbi:hypothetical protein X975_03959, partial [Stegodyphus mimosarum]
MIKIAVLFMVLGMALAGDLLFGNNLALPLHPVRSLGYYGYPIRTVVQPVISSGFRDISSGFRDVSAGYRDISSGYAGSLGLTSPFYGTLY